MGISTFLPIILVILAVAIVLGILASGYVKAPPDKVFIISGLRKKPKMLMGKSGIKFPFLERKDELLAKQISVDIKTNGYIPTLDFIGVDVDAIAKIQIDTSEDGLALAMKNFLNMKEQQIVESLTDSLQGNMREIIGTITLKEISNDRKKFGDEVQSKAQQDMNALGIKIISCNIQRIEDENGLINALGQDNLSQIQKSASIAKAQAERDIAIAQAEAAKLANDAKIASETEIAKKNNELAIQKAELKRAADVKRAEADAAYDIQKEEQRKTIEITTANANLAKQEKEIELKERAVAIKERTLEAEVKKTAEAEKYAEQQEADARLYTTQKDSEAELFERQKKAEAEKFEAEQAAEAAKARSEAQRIAMENEAKGIEAKGKAEAAAIQAKAEAEAAGILKKAEAMKEFQDAAMVEMQIDALKAYFAQLPAIAEAAGKAYTNVDKIYMYGGDSSKLTENVINTMTQVSEGLSESLGIDLKSMLGGFLGAKLMEKNSQVSVNIEGQAE